MAESHAYDELAGIVAKGKLKRKKIINDHFVRSTPLSGLE